MKKILFSDRFGLTQAVLEGRKTMTRRIVNFGRVHTLIPGRIAKCCLMYAPYKVGEVVAVAQNYGDVFDEFAEKYYVTEDPIAPNFENFGRQNDDLKKTAGWTNKMFVRAELMPHQIRITNVRVERLQDISDEDCLREGILEDCPGVQYSFPTKIGYCGQYPFDTPRDAFADLIDKVSGKGTWKSNPRVFVYEFELIKKDEL